MFSFFSSEPRDLRLRELCAPALRACKQLGVRWMVLHPDVFAGAFDRSHRAAVLAGNVDFFRSLLPTSEETGVGIAIENIFDSAGRHGNRQCCRFFGAVPDELCELIDAMNHPLIGACWDTGHAKLMQHDQKACLTALGSRLKALHVQENDGKNDDHMLPFVNGGEGVRWKDITDGLSAARYQGPFTYETHNAFGTLPDELLDITLDYAVAVGRYLSSQVRIESV
jgi:sugar phosphate isomerase/epimerase